MAAGATIYRANLNIADMDRSYYADHALTLARHPSETDERMMVRLLAFAFHAHERLEFGRGIGTAAEPDLCQRDLTGRIQLWIEVGQPEDRRVRQACGQADRVVIYSYGVRIVEPWWAKVGTELARCKNLEVVVLPPATTQALGAMAERNMDLQMTVQEGDAWLACHAERIAIEREWLLKPEQRGR